MLVITSNDDFMTNCRVTSVVILLASAWLLLRRTSENKFMAHVLRHICRYMNNSCTLVTTSNENSMADGWVTSVVVLAAAVVVLEAAAKLLQFQIRVSTKCFLLSIFIFSNKSRICFLKTDEDDSISLTRT
jgi:hypothetical protein